MARARDKVAGPESVPPPGKIGTVPTDGSGHQPAAAGRRRGVFRALGLGLITGAADDDCSAIGTYAAAGAQAGPAFLWTAPVTFPMMFAVVYLSAKLGQVSGRGLFHAIRDYLPRWVLYPTLVGVLIGNTIEAGADIGGMAASVDVFLPVPFQVVVIGTALVILTLQFVGSYTLIRNAFRWLALALLAYVGAAVLARPELGPVLAGTFIPTIHFSADFLALLVAIIGTSLSAYLYTWQSNEEVEEEISHGRTQLSQRIGASDEELKHSRRDVLFGMFFSNVIMYFIILATGSTLFRAGQNDINTAADAAQALRPLAGDAAGVLFALGVVGVGFLAVPVMTTGAAYDLAQTLGWKYGLHAQPREAKKFYAAIALFTLIGVGMNFIGLNPMHFLVWSGVIQGFSTPPLMLLIMLMTNNRRIMGERVNGRAINVLGWVTTGAIFAATLGLVVSWLM
ncbi:MAG: Nramp family divalent metal transporter [Chloroflexi bacterium]|nr:Nramp family divalent metal transporter [Chloroflexota bacterium]